MSKQWGRLLCKLGLHRFMGLRDPQRFGLPLRYCVRCRREQGLFRGAGGDQWDWT